MTSRASLVESLIGATKYFYSNFFHVFENCFGPPGAGELKFEQIPRAIVRSLCCLVGPSAVRRVTPKKWLEKAQKETAVSIRKGPGIKEWLPLQIANFTTWPRYVSTARYPPPPSKVRGSNCRITYYGHSGVFIQTEESNIMVDPFFGSKYGLRYVMGKVETVGFGVRRVKQPAWDLEDPDGPPLHLILATHDHIDSFDKSAVKCLLNWSGPTFCAGRGMSRHIFKREGPSVYFMDWYDSIKYDLLKIQFLPAVHSSGRGFVLDRNGVLWGSFLIASDSASIYHAGGTGFSEHFQMIADNMKNLDRQIDLAILPIGNYEVGGMQNLYLTPDEAVNAFKVLKAKKALAITHDTFPLGIERFGQPKRDLLEALHRNSVSPADFFVLEPGEHFYLSGEAPEELEGGKHALGRIEELDDWTRQVAYEESITNGDYYGLHV